MARPKKTWPACAALVDQVRDYRNWVAHGRRELPTNYVTPKQAYARLVDFLDALGITAEAEEDANRLEQG